jgi:hypothetical protein
MRKRRLPFRSDVLVDRLTLRAEIADIFRDAGNVWMDHEDIVAAIAERGRFHHLDGRPITVLTIIRQLRNYPNLFERQGTRARLRDSGDAEGASEAAAQA